MPGQQNDGKAPRASIAAALLRERHEIRYAASIEIEVSGVDQAGKVFHEAAFTRNVSEWGCAFLLSIELHTDDIISLRVVSGSTGEFASAKQSPFQILDVNREPDGWLVRAWKLGDADVWGMDLEKTGTRLEGTDELPQSGS